MGRTQKRILCQVICKALHRISEKVLPFYESEKSSADHSVSSFSDKISKIREMLNRLSLMLPLSLLLTFKHHSDE